MYVCVACTCALYTGGVAGREEGFGEGGPASVLGPALKSLGVGVTEAFSPFSSVLRDAGRGRGRATGTGAGASSAIGISLGLKA